jgi:hypothetical protein
MIKIFNLRQLSQSELPRAKTVENARTRRNDMFQDNNTVYKLLFIVTYHFTKETANRDEGVEGVQCQIGDVMQRVAF